MTQDQTTPENKILDAEEATARRLYADWVGSMKPELRTAWLATWSDESLKEQRTDAYKASAASAGRKETITYANHLVEASVKKYRVRGLQPEAKIETMSAINHGVAMTMAQADPDKGSIMGYLHAVVRSERADSLYKQSLPLSHSGLRTWAKIRQIQRTASAAITDDEIISQLKEIKDKKGRRLHTDKSIEEAQRYRKLGAHALVSLDSPMGEGDEDTAQALKVQATEYKIVTTRQNAVTPSLESPFMRQFRRIVETKLTPKEKGIILRRFLEEEGETIQEGNVKNAFIRAIRKLRKDKSLAPFAKKLHF